jgi:hypothetical protein
MLKVVLFLVCSDNRRRKEEEEKENTEWDKADSWRVETAGEGDTVLVSCQSHTFLR